MDYKDKIKKLLALAESPNENEAQAALLKARQLMAEHKIGEADLEEPEDKEILHKRTSVTFSKRRDGWISNLAVVIAENYCCMASVCHYKGKQTYTVQLNGFKSDVEICERVLLFAVEFVQGKNKMRQWSDNYPYSPKEKLAICNAYGEGFTSGLDEKFDKQSRQQAVYALVLKTPQKVKDSLKDYGTLKADFTPTLDGIREAALQMQITKQEIETMIQQAVLAGKAAADTSAKDFYKATERRLYALETLRAKIAEDIQRQRADERREQ